MLSDDLLLDASGLVKRFFGSFALNGASFQLRRGEIHALVGENGAGKSTFIKILAGVYALDEGKILFEGRQVDPRQDSLPIAFVHQDLALVDDLSVAENIALTAGYPKWLGLIDWAGVARQAEKTYGVMQVEPIDPHRLVATLSTPEKAILGIVRSLALAPKVLVLDEPTAALPEQDSLRLFAALRRLRDAGTSIIYVSHRLNELFGLADRVTVFRDGRWVYTAPMTETDPDRLIEQMLGRAVVLGRGQRQAAGARKELLAVKDLMVRHRGPMSFEARAGEIVGLVGLRGGGQEAIGRALFGAIAADSGSITLDGRQLSLRDGIGDRIAAGIVLLAGDRTSESTFAGMTLTENLFVNPELKRRSPWKLTTPRAEQREARARLETFDVRPRNERSLIDWLSGGNQQKVCIARWLEADARVVILEEPTAGVDIGAKLAIHAILRKAAAAGKAMVVVSSDLDEVAMLCDRAIIINRGRVASELEGEHLTMDALIAHSSRGGDAGGADTPVDLRAPGT